MNKYSVNSYSKREGRTLYFQNEQGIIKINGMSTKLDREGSADKWWI